MPASLKTPASYAMLLEAIAFAARAHDGQKRKDKITPYISHPFRVMLTTRHLFNIQDERMLAAAILHDTLEDTETSMLDLRKKFGKEIAQWVRLLSKDRSLPKTIREARYERQIRRSPDPVLIVKLADIYDNLTNACQLGKFSEMQKAVERLGHYLSVIEEKASSKLRPMVRLVWLKHSQLKKSIHEKRAH